MSLDRDPLWAKSRLFFERAFEHPREDPQFALWCAMGLELLARAAVASVSPTLLAEPDRDHKNLLHAIGKGDPRVGPQSITINQTIRLCQHLFEDFTPENATAALALMNRRNAELHTGAAAFENYTTQQWIAGFYGCCQALVTVLAETLVSLLGEAEAAVAVEVLAEVEQGVRQRVESEIGAHRRVFLGRSDEERQGAIAAATEATDRLAQARHHSVECPSCQSAASVQGETFGSARVSHDEAQGEIVVRQSVAPRRFSCSVCGLKLEGYAALAAAGLGNQYTRTTRYSPAEYYELIDPSDYDTMQDLVDDYRGEYRYGDEYDNE